MTELDGLPITVGPRSAPWINAAVVAGGGRVVDAPEARAVVWTHNDDAHGLAALLEVNPQVDWVQLPWAGVEPYAALFDDGRVWSCAKGVYADPVAEHALALLLAGFRHLHRYAAADAWGEQAGRNLLGASVTIIGGGGIAQVLVDLLSPFRCQVTVVRRRPRSMEGVDVVLPPERLHDALVGADAVVLALPLLSDTVGVIGAAELAAMPEHAWLVNVARGAHVDTEALVAALDAGAIGGAALDVTDPEPLPDGHPLWSRPDVVITPHTANTRAMARPLLGARITENVRRRIAGDDLVGLVDPQLGY
ncbi:MAG: dihydrofolate reductase [Acidimicrobiales bacterium]|nr:dihydrofolate reductase [Acidimicrobiales bacterium]